MKKLYGLFPAAVLFICIVLLACQKDATTTSTNTDTNGDGTSDLPDVFKKFTSDVDVYVEGNYVIIKSNGIPNHKSPYFDTNDSRYETYNGTNTRFQLNPNRIREKDYTFRIPLHPQEASSKQETPLGPMGVAVNGVPIYNQYAAMRAKLTNEINSFDQYNGHPQQEGAYHYHVEPLYLTKNNGKESLIGFLLDGFPVYGPYENGKKVNNSDLDAYHGHTSATTDYPNGIYHYHITDEDPYINGDGFYGKPGTVSQ